MSAPHLQHSCTTRIEGLGVGFGGMTVLEHVGLTLHCGELTAVIGRNGAGKTTLLRALMGVIPHQGRISFSSEDGGAISRPKLGYVPQSLHFDRLSPLRVVDIFAACMGARPVFLGIGKKTRAEVLRALSYTEAEHLIERRLGALSGGELQRVLLALALTPLPQLLLLDEPVSGVDRNGLLLFYDLLDMLRTAHDLSILLVSHDVELAAHHADRMALLGDKNLLMVGTPAEVLESEAYREVFGHV